MKKFLKKALSVILAAIFLLSVIPFSVFGFKDEWDTNDDGYRFTVKDDGTVEITEFIGSDTELVIPSKLNGYSVTSIGEEVFSDNLYLEHVTISEGIVSIAENAFYGCASLRSIVIPNGVTSIENCAFYDCYSLENVTIPESVSSIGNWVFTECTSLKSIDVASGNTSYSSENGILYNYDKTVLLCYPAGKSDSEFTVPESVTSIGINAFDSCSSLVSITIPDSVTSIEEEAFYGCSSLVNVTIPSGLTAIKNLTFFDCSSLVTVAIPESVTSIGNSAFKGCEKLIEVVNNSSLDITAGSEENGYVAYYAQSVKTDGESDVLIQDSFVFYPYEGTNYLLGYFGNEPIIVLPESYKGETYQIVNNAYFNRSTLVSITIPESVTSIGESAFEGCEKLIEVINKSSLDITAGSEDNGYVAYYARSVETDGESDFSVQNGIIIYPDSYSYEGTDYIDYTIIGFTENITEIVLPELNGDNETYYVEIGAFSGCKSLEKIIILGENDTGIANGAFENCTSLKNVTISGSYTWIGTDAFKNCTSLESVTVSKGVIGINEGAFYGCTSLSNIVIPEIIGPIGSGTFYGCESLKSIVMEGAAAIESYAFYDCSSLKNVMISESVTSIGAYAFYGCKSLRSIVIPEGVTAIEDYTFYNCSFLENVTVPESVTSIGEYAFYGCGSLTGIAIPEGVTAIEDYTFYSCSSLGNVTIPESVTSIGAYAFYDCNSLKSLEIPGSVTYFGDSVFEDCSSLESLVMSDGASGLGWYAFRYCTSLKSVILPSSLKYIPKEAFWGCSSLESFVIPEGVTSIGEDAFYYCDSLKNITIPEGVTSIDFGGCTSLTSITIPEGVTSIDFRGCTSLTNITIPKGVTSIDFGVCTSLTSITIPEGVTSIDFGGCTSLTNITIPEGVTSIDFQGCTSLISITIPESVTSIEWCAFEGCTSLTNVVMPEGLTTICPRAFYKCSSLVSITIPENVTSIGSLAFEGCVKLVEAINKSSLDISKGNSYMSGYNYVGARNVKTDGESDIVNQDDFLFYTYEGTNYLLGYVGSDLKLVLPESYNGETYQIYDYAFENRLSLVSVTVPESVTSIGSYAFNGCKNLVEVINKSSLDISVEGGYYNGGGIASYAWNVKTDGESDITVQDEYVFYSSEGVNYLLCYLGNKTDLVLPESCNGETYQIYDKAFYVEPVAPTSYSTLKSVTIPEGVTSIGESAFGHCRSLESVVIPSSITSIGESAFEGCNSLTNVVISDGVTTIGERAFEFCRSLTSIVLPDSVTAIGDYAFQYCDELQIITLSESLASIGENAFYECFKLLEVINKSSLKIEKRSTDNGGVAYCAINVKESGESDTVTEGDFKFYVKDGINYLVGYLGNVKNVVLPESYKGETYQIYDYAFCYESNLKNIMISDGVTSIGAYAFYNCCYLENITIPDNVTSIEEGAFYGCDSILNITIPDSITSIEAYTFYNCNCMENITIPESLTSIGAYAFGVCKSLRNIEIPESVTSIEEGAFYDCSCIVYVVLPSGIDVIEDSTFESCSELRNITIPEGITSIGNAAFSGCDFTSIKIPENVTSIGENVFYRCCNLENITIPDSVTSIGDCAFSECSSFENITLPDNITSIGQNAFEGTAYYNNTDNWENDALYIGNYLIEFDRYSSEDSFTVKKGTKLIADFAFNECYLEYITIADSVTSIGKGAFNNCSNIKEFSVVLGNTAYSSENGVLYNSDKTELMYYPQGKPETEFTVPESVVSIANSAFVNVSRLRSITIHKNVVSIGYCYFYSSSLEKIYYAGSVEEWNAIIVPDSYLNGVEIIFNCNFELSSDDVKLEASKAVLDEKAELKVTAVTGDGTDEILANIGSNFKTSEGTLYNISLELDGAEIQPSGKVKIYIPVPADKDGENCRVFHIAEDGTVTDMNAVYENGYMVFETDHFSYYAIVESAVTVILGDVNGDGIITTYDLICIKRYIIGKYTEDDVVFANSDIDGNGIISLSDLRLLKKIIVEK